MTRVTWFVRHLARIIFTGIVIGLALASLLRDYAMRVHIEGNRLDHLVNSATQELGKSGALQFDDDEEEK